MVKPLYHKAWVVLNFHLSLQYEKQWREQAPALLGLCEYRTNHRELSAIVASHLGEVSQLHCDGGVLNSLLGNVQNTLSLLFDISVNFKQSFGKQQIISQRISYKILPKLPQSLRDSSLKREPTWLLTRQKIVAGASPRPTRYCFNYSI